MLRRGFKSECERLALAKREDAGKEANDPLDPWGLAATMGIRVITPHDVPGISTACLETLLEADPSSWSAVTLALGRAGDLVILNSATSPARQASSLMHELAHALLGHTPSRVDVSEDNQLLLRTHDPDQEEEANWLAGCLLLPRPALLSIRSSRASRASLLAKYKVSAQMLRYRLSVTGVERQADRATRRAQRS